MGGGGTAKGVQCVQNARFTLAENTSYQQPTVARTLKMSSGWKLSNALLDLSHLCFKFVFWDFSRLNSTAIFIPDYNICLAAILCVAG